MDEQQKQDDTQPSSTEAQAAGESPNVVSAAADASASGTSSSVPTSSPVVDTQAAASSGETAGEQGNAIASVVSGSTDSAISSPVIDASNDTATLNGAGTESAGQVDSGNVDASTSLAGAATSVVTDADVGNVGGSASTADANTTTTQPELKSASDAGTAATSATSQASSSDLGADAGNVLAGGVQLAGITSDSTEHLDEATNDHPAKPHLTALRRKIESGEAIVMSELIRLIHAIEETL
jgi:hypothetical protein